MKLILQFALLCRLCEGGELLDRILAKLVYLTFSPLLYIPKNQHVHESRILLFICHVGWHYADIKQADKILLA